MNNRWIASKFGLFNFWYYENQEFDLADGKILFRGTNGSGKSVTTQSFIPLLLDGDKRPNRIDPFGTKSRKIENYLLTDDKIEDRIAYLYMQFKKEDSNTYMTIGMGLRAKKGRQQVESCYFILKDGRQINKDLMLYKNKENMLPITFKQLETALGNGNFYTTSQQEYMKKVNENLFGYSDIESYKELLNLLISLRSPKLSKDFKPTVIYEILKDSLTTLSDDDLRTMAESMDNMDELNNKVEEYEKSLRACNKIKAEFDKYNALSIYKVAQKLKTKENEVKKEEKNIDSLKFTILENKQVLKDEVNKLNELQSELEASKESYNKLEKSEAKAIKEEITKEENRFKNILEKLEKIDIRKENKIKEEIENNKKIEELESYIYKIDKQIKDLLIDENNLRIDAYYKEHDDFEKEILTSNSYSFNLILESISNYEKLISEIYQLIVKYDSVKKQNEELEDKKYSKELDIKVHKNKLNEALEYLTTIKTETIEKINKYLSNTNTLTIEKNILEEIYNIINSIKDRYEYNKVLDLVKESKNNKEDKLKDDKNKLSLKKKEITNDKNKLKTELEKIINDKEVFEENNWFTEAKTILDKEKIPYKKLYECIDFKENLLDEEKKIIESSLLDMGIIDSIIVPNEYRLKAENLLKNNTYKILCKNEKTNKDNLSKYISLEEDNFTKEYSNDIYSIIESISINTDENNTYIDLDNNFKIGIIKGITNTEYELKYIGSKKREQYRLEKISTLENKIEELNIILENLNENINKIDNSIEILNKEYKEFITGEDIDEEIKLIEEIEIDLRTKEKEFISINENIYKVKKDIKEISNLLFEETEHINIPKNTESYQSVIDSIREYKEVINEIRQAYNKKNSILKETEIHISINEAVKNDLEIIYEEIGTLKNEKLTLTKNIESLKNALKSLGIDEIEKELDRLSNIISTYPHSISLLIESKAKREANIKNYIDRLNELEINLNTKNKELNFYKENFRYELNLGYIEELKALEECEAIEYVIEKYKLSESYKQNDIISNIHEIIRESSLELNNYNIGVYDTDNIYTNYEDENIKGLVEISKRVDIRIKLHKKEISLYDLIKKLNLNIEEHNLLINENERKVFEDILINNLSTKISARISRAKNWVKEIDKLMDKVNTSNGLKLNITWVPKKGQSEDDIDIKELSTLLSTSKFLTEEEREKVSKHFKLKLKQQKRRMEDENKISSYQYIIKEVLDFRRWFEFKLMYTTPRQNKKELTDNEFYRLSGGEKALAMYIPLFAAVNARYDGADKKDCPRMISLDEAFAGVDEENISHMFNLMEGLDLDYVLNSQVLWGTYEGVKNLAIYELIREGSDMVIPIKYTWNGHSKIVDLGE